MTKTAKKEMIEGRSQIQIRRETNELRRRNEIGALMVNRSSRIQENGGKVLVKKPSLTPKPTSESNLISSLPNELLLSCLARVPRLYYPSLSLVSKSFRSILDSPELYDARSLLHRKESRLYVCLCFPNDPNPHWFTLCRKPDRKPTKCTSKRKKKSGNHLLVAIPLTSSPPPPLIPSWSCLVAVGSNIYKIGGPIRDVDVDDEYLDLLSTRVSVLDCRTNTWREAPNMLVERMFPRAQVVDGKIYVEGGLEDDDFIKSIEVFDPNNQTWDHVPSPDKEVKWGHVRKTANIDGKFHLIFDGNSLVYDPKESRWDLVQGEVSRHGNLSVLETWSYCRVDNVLYCYHCYHMGTFKWYDTKTRLWKEMKGMVGLPKFTRFSSHVNLADYGGKMAVLWDKNSPPSGYKKKMIWCAEIALEKRKGDEIWGKIEWLGGVLAVPGSYELVKVLVVTL